MCYLSISLSPFAFPPLNISPPPATVGRVLFLLKDAVADEPTSAAAWLAQPESSGPLEGICVPRSALVFCCSAGNSAAQITPAGRIQLLGPVLGFT